MPRGKYERTPKHREQMRNIKREASSLWKGDNVSLNELHKWVRRWKSKTGVCSNCGQKRYTEWANIDGKYRRKLEDYIELCAPCHRRKDKHPWLK